MKMKVEVNGICLNYKKVGNGNPLILLHGNGEDHSIFDKLIEKLKNDFTVYALDSRNHGESSKTDDYSYYTMMEDIHLFINSLNLNNVSVVGFSDGAIIALLVEQNYPGTFKYMTLLGINLKPADFKKNILVELKHAYEESKDPLLKLMLEEPNIELSTLSEIKTPTLIVAAQHDIFYRKTYTDMLKAMPNARFEIMQGHDHASYVIHEDILYPYLQDFMK